MFSDCHNIQIAIIMTDIGIEVMMEDILYKCTPCGECFLTESVFFAHTRTWHCKILVNSGQNPQRLKESELEDLKNVCDEKFVQNNGWGERNADEDSGSEDTTMFNIIDTDITDSFSVNTCANNFPTVDSVISVNPDFICPVVTNWNNNVLECSNMNDALCIKTEEIEQNIVEPNLSSSVKQVSNIGTGLNLRHRKILPKKSRQKHQCSYERQGGEATRIGPFMSTSKQQLWHCNLCSYETIRKSDLAKHIRRHTGERPFQCSYCNQGFHASSDKCRHMRRCAVFRK